MTNARIDQNNRPTMIATLNTNGKSIVRITANVSSNNGMSINDNTTGSDNGNNSGVANLDENSNPVMTALSSAGDGTLVEVYADSTGHLLINSQ